MRYVCGRFSLHKKNQQLPPFSVAVAHFNLVGKVRNAHARLDPFNKIMVNKGHYFAGEKVGRPDTMPDVWIPGSKTVFERPHNSFVCVYDLGERNKLVNKKKRN